MSSSFSIPAMVLRPFVHWHLLKRLFALHNYLKSVLFVLTVLGWKTSLKIRGFDGRFAPFRLLFTTKFCLHMILLLRRYGGDYFAQLFIAFLAIFLHVNKLIYMYHYATRNSAYVIDKIDFLVYFFTDMIQVCFSVLKTIINLIYFIHKQLYTT